MTVGLSGGMSNVVGALLLGDTALPKQFPMKDSVVLGLLGELVVMEAVVRMGGANGGSK